MTLQEIQARMDEIKGEIETRGGELTAEQLPHWKRRSPNSRNSGRNCRRWPNSETLCLIQ